MLYVKDANMQFIIDRPDAFSLLHERIESPKEARCGACGRCGSVVLVWGGAMLKRNRTRQRYCSADGQAK